MMKVVVTTGAVRHAKLQSDRHHRQTNTHSLSQFQRPFFQVNLGQPVPIESKDDGGGGDN